MEGTGPARAAAAVRAGDAARMAREVVTVVKEAVLVYADLPGTRQR